MCLTDQATYRQKIKGFHLAFNVREPAVELTDGTFKAKAWDKSARDHREKSQLMKTNRINNQQLREKIKQDQYLKEREHFK